MDKKIKYCPNCGKQIHDDGIFCAKCGTNIHTYNKTTPIRKNNQTRNILLILLAIVIITSLLILGGAHISKKDDKGFKTYAFSDTCTVELPTWIKFNEDNYSSSASSEGVNMQDYSKTLSSTNDELYTIMYVKTTFNGETLGVDDAGEVSSNIGDKEHYSRHVTNGRTGESVWIQGTNKTLVDYVADHVRFNGKNTTNTIDNNSKSNSNSKTNTGDRYEVDVIGTFDKVTGKYIDGPQAGKTKSQAEASVYYDAYDDGGYGFNDYYADSNPLPESTDNRTA